MERNRLGATGNVAKTESKSNNKRTRDDHLSVVTMCMGCLTGRSLGCTPQAVTSRWVCQISGSSGSQANSEACYMGAVGSVD